MTLNFVAFTVRTTEAELHMASCPAYSYRRVYPTSMSCTVRGRGCLAAIFW